MFNICSHNALFSLLFAPKLATLKPQSCCPSETYGCTAGALGAPGGTYDCTALLVNLHNDCNFNMLLPYMGCLADTHPCSSAWPCPPCHRVLFSVQVRCTQVHTCQDLMAVPNCHASQSLHSEHTDGLARIMLYFI